jgi:hypothetical protein
MEFDYSENLKKMISDNIMSVKQAIEDAETAAGREKGSVTLIGVTKVFPVEYAEAAAVSGLTDLGENRVQELVPKVERFSSLGLDVNWHLIGTLQKNKVKYIIGKTHLIHSVNTIELAEEISKRSQSNNVTTRILLQANVSGEESKHGFAPHELKPAADKIMALPNITVCGLMTMAPIETYEGQAREVFARTRVIFEDLKKYTGLESFEVLSMGMSQDYKSAILEGATHIRIGTAIFGNRAEYRPV